MKKPTDTTLAFSADYRQFVEGLKARVATARLSAARRINHEMIVLYWDNLEFPGLRRARSERPGGPTEISRGWSVAEPPDLPSHTFKPRQRRQKYPVQFRFACFCRPCRGSRGLLDGFRGYRSFLALPPANFFGPSRGRSHARSKANPISVAACALPSKLPGELKGKLPTAKQLAGIVRAKMEGGK